MPDILEDGEIVEYEEVPRCELLATESCVGGVKGRRDGGQSSETLVDEVGGEARGMDKAGKNGEIMNIEPTLPSVVLGKRPRESTFLDPLTNITNRTEFRETTAPEFQSSSPDYKRAKVVHIPSAAELREEARKRRLQM
ncbi:hypothetical protein ES702_03139 [subsurface metagenome]